MRHLEEEVLNAYCAGQVDDRTIDAIEEHLIDCDGCRQVYTDLTDVLGVDPNPEVLPDLGSEA